MKPQGGGSRSILIVNARQVLTMATRGQPKRGAALADPGLLADAAIAIRDGRIAALGTYRRARRALGGAEARVIEADGCLVLPGFVDPHTHLIFAGQRAAEFEGRLLTGRSFLQYVQAGSGSLDTVRRTRRASDQDLADLVAMRLRRLLAAGTTTVEVKSGYGLSVEEELRHLRLLRGLSLDGYPRVVLTALAAHFRPPEQPADPGRYVDEICESFIPVVAAERLATTVDVFCEPGVYSPEQCRRILTTARDHGLGARVHADQLSNSGGAELAAELGAESADHLGHISSAGIAALARSETAAVLIPGSLFFVPGEKAPPVREMIEAGVIVAISSDLNPGSSPIYAPALTVGLACVLFRLSVAEALAAATINAAWALRVHQDAGSLELGKRADLVIAEGDDYRHIAYRFGENLIRWVVAGGEVAAERAPVGVL